MCGFAGYFTPLGQNSYSENYLILEAMADTITHRGPDGEGYWIDNNLGVGLAHRRLAIVDLSASGAQPMISGSGRFVIVFNGEIYNHLSLRDSLQRANQFNGNWLSHSDTETLLEAFDAWGIEDTLKQCIGMFAFALWDKLEQKLILGRDRFGEKPLYFGWHGEGANRSFLFGSELKALKAHPSFSGKIDRGSICLLLRHNYIPAPYSIYKDIFKLDSGSILTVCLTNPDPIVTKYWDAFAIASKSKTTPFTGSPEQAVDELEKLAKSAVNQQMIAEVPLGAFLSGGVDSSAIVALMQAQSSCPVKTFTIGFNEKNFNEAVHARAVARHLGTDHTELYISPNQALEVIPKIPNFYCEPFADSSQIATYLVSELAKKDVTVALSGDAGDELFCGYNRYKLTSQLWDKLSLVPPPIRGFASDIISSISPAAWDQLSAIIPGKKNYTSLGDKIYKGAGVMASANLHQLYLGMVSNVSNPSEWVVDAFEYPTKLISNSSLGAEFDDIEIMMLLDTVSYLPDDILVKVDRAAMGVSIEGRVPFLDHRIFEFTWSLPLDYKLRNGETKWPLRQLLYRYVPKELIERPKMGFGIPVADWLRGPLRDWAETLLSENRLRREGYFHPEIVRAKWAEHLSGRRNWQSQLWTVLMFQAWLENEK